MVPSTKNPVNVKSCLGDHVELSVSLNNSH